MRAPGLALAGILLTSPAVVPGLAPAMAQVTVNPGALDLLPSQPQRTAPARPAARPVPHPAARPAAPPAQAPVPATTRPAVPPAAPPPTVPVVPPAIAALPPPLPVPAPRTQPVPVVPVAADAPGVVTPLPGGLRVTFGPDRAELNPTTEAALRELARTLRAADKGSINVYAYASGSADDPSTARRLSLARALAARGVLINEGIVSTRIYPRALGTAGGDTDKDRVDVTAGPPGPPPASPAAATSPIAPK